MRSVHNDVAACSGNSPSSVAIELHRPLGEVLAAFDHDPIAAASLSPVHRARLARPLGPDDGTDAHHGRGPRPQPGAPGTAFPLRRLLIGVSAASWLRRTGRSSGLHVAVWPGGDGVVARVLRSEVASVRRHVRGGTCRSGAGPLRVGTAPAGSDDACTIRATHLGWSRPADEVPDAIAALAA